jgi:hypothetical protein
LFWISCLIFDCLFVSVKPSGPFPGTPLSEIAVAVANGKIKPEFPSILKPNVKAFCERLCAFDPSQRPAFQVRFLLSFLFISFFLIFFLNGLFFDFVLGNC